MSQDTKTLLEWSNKYLFQNYGRAPLCLVRGEGARVWDTDGKEYLDFVGGIAVDALGHSHPKIVGAIREQATALLQVSNLYQIPSQIHLAKLLVDHSFGDRAFFCNSGTEANEAAIKLARKYAKETRATDVVDIITMRGAFHGRTLGALSATPNEKYQHGFEPLRPRLQVRPVRRRRRRSSARWTTGPPPSWSSRSRARAGSTSRPTATWPCLRRLCDETGALLVFDEIQTGMGRTGSPLGLPALGRRARRHDPREGARQRDPDRRDGRPGSVRPGDGGRHPRHDLRRQPVRHDGGRRDLHHDARGQAPRARRPGGNAPDASGSAPCPRPFRRSRRSGARAS